MVAIAKCESNFNPKATGPTQDAGLFQIHLPSHQKRLDELGLDPYDIEDNIQFAQILYKESGVRPWVCARMV